jgi:hypothetical protein
MTTKEKANDIYNYAIRLHGYYEGKQQAINSAVAIQTLAPFDQQKYWSEVIKQIELK